MNLIKQHRRKEKCKRLIGSTRGNYEVEKIKLLEVLSAFSFNVSLDTKQMFLPKPDESILGDLTSSFELT